MTIPTGIHCVIPSRLGVGEAFTVRLRLLGPPQPVPCRGAFCTRKPQLGSPFNLNVQRQIQFQDDVLPEWAGSLRIIGENLSGPQCIDCDGKNQGTFPGDKRPITARSGFYWNTPGCEDDLHRIVVVTAAGEQTLDIGAEDPRNIEIAIDHPSPQGGDYRYFRIGTTTGELAWSSPVFSGKTRS